MATITNVYFKNESKQTYFFKIEKSQIKLFQIQRKQKGLILKTLNIDSPTETNSYFCNIPFRTAEHINKIKELIKQFNLIEDANQFSARTRAPKKDTKPLLTPNGKEYKYKTQISKEEKGQIKFFDAYLDKHRNIIELQQIDI